MKIRTKMNLSTEAKNWHDELAKAYQIEDVAGKLLLQSAMESFDRMRDAQVMIKKHGVVYLDRYQQPKPNPACSVERDQRSQMLACLKALNLDIEII